MEIERLEIVSRETQRLLVEMAKCDFRAVHDPAVELLVLLDRKKSFINAQQLPGSLVFEYRCVAMGTKRKPDVMSALCVDPGKFFLVDSKRKKADFLFALSLAEQHMDSGHLERMGSIFSEALTFQRRFGPVLGLPTDERKNNFEMVLSKMGWGRYFGDCSYEDFCEQVESRINPGSVSVRQMDLRIIGDPRWFLYYRSERLPLLLKNAMCFWGRERWEGFDEDNRARACASLLVGDMLSFERVRRN